MRWTVLHITLFIFQWVLSVLYKELFLSDAILFWEKVLPQHLGHKKNKLVRMNKAEQITEKKVCNQGTLWQSLYECLDI